jgi:hypothetical protein
MVPRSEVRSQPYGLSILGLPVMSFTLGVLAGLILGLFFGWLFTRSYYREVLKYATFVRDSLNREISSKNRLIEDKDRSIDGLTIKLKEKEELLRWQNRRSRKKKFQRKRSRSGR